MHLSDLRALYAPVTDTVDPRVKVGWNGPRRGRDFALLVRDDLGDWDRTGPVYPTKAEAFAAVGPTAARYYG